MIMYNIDYKQIIENYNIVINTLEYDSMRSGGKSKLNVQNLHYLYAMKEKYEEQIKPKTKPKEVK